MAPSLPLTPKKPKLPPLPNRKHNPQLSPLLSLPSPLHSLQPHSPQLSPQLLPRHKLNKLPKRVVSTRW